MRRRYLQCPKRHLSARLATLLHSSCPAAIPNPRDTPSVSSAGSAAAAAIWFGVVMPASARTIPRLARRGAHELGPDAPSRRRLPGTP